MLNQNNAIKPSTIDEGLKQKLVEKVGAEKIGKALSSDEAWNSLPWAQRQDLIQEIVKIEGVNQNDKGNWSLRAEGQNTGTTTEVAADLLDNLGTSEPSTPVPAEVAVTPSVERAQKVEINKQNAEQYIVDMKESDFGDPDTMRRVWDVVKDDADLKKGLKTAFENIKPHDNLKSILFSYREIDGLFDLLGGIGLLKENFGNWISKSNSNKDIDRLLQNLDENIRNAIVEQLNSKPDSESGAIYKALMVGDLNDKLQEYNKELAIILISKVVEAQKKKAESTSSASKPAAQPTATTSESPSLAPTSVEDAATPATPLTEVAPAAQADEVDPVKDTDISQLGPEFFNDEQLVANLYNKLDLARREELKKRFFEAYGNDVSKWSGPIMEYDRDIRNYLLDIDPNGAPADLDLLGKVVENLQRSHFVDTEKIQWIWNAVKNTPKQILDAVVLGFKNSIKDKQERLRLISLFKKTKELQGLAVLVDEPTEAIQQPTPPASEIKPFNLQAEFGSFVEYGNPGAYLAKLNDMASKAGLALAQFVNQNNALLVADLGQNLRLIAADTDGSFDSNNTAHAKKYNDLAAEYKKIPELSNLVPDLPATTSQITEAFKDGKVELRDLNVLSPADVYRYIAEARTKNAQIFEATKTQIKTAIADRVARENMKPRQTHKLAMEFLNSPMASGIPQDIYKDTLLGKKYEYSDSTVDRMIPVFQGLYAQARNEQNLEAFWDTKVLPKVLERFAFEVSGEPGTLYKAERMFIEGVQWLKDFDKASGVTDPQGSANGIVKMTIDMVKTDFSSNKLAKDQTNFTYDQVRDSYYKKVQDYLSKEKITFDPQILDRIIDTNAANILNYVNENIKIDRTIKEKQEVINEIDSKEWKSKAWKWSKGIILGGGILGAIGSGSVLYGPEFVLSGFTTFLGSRYLNEQGGFQFARGFFDLSRLAIGGSAFALVKDYMSGDKQNKNPEQEQNKKLRKEFDSSKLDAQIQREQKYAELINKIKSEVRGSVASLQQTAGNTFADAVRMSRDGLSNMPNMYTGQNYRRFSY